MLSQQVVAEFTQTELELSTARCSMKRDPQIPEVYSLSTGALRNNGKWTSTRNDRSLLVALLK